MNIVELKPFFSDKIKIWFCEEDYNYPENVWIIEKYKHIGNNVMTCISVDISEHSEIQNVEQFNAKCSELFGFKLKEVAK